MHLTHCRQLSCSQEVSAASKEVALMQLSAAAEAALGESGAAVKVAGQQGALARLAAAACGRRGAAAARLDELWARLDGLAEQVGPLLVVVSCYPRGAAGGTSRP